MDEIFLNGISKCGFEAKMIRFTIADSRVVETSNLFFVLLLVLQNMSRKPYVNALRTCSLRFVNYESQLVVIFFFCKQFYAMHL